jgi:hypothetical protein
MKLILYLIFRRDEEYDRTKEKNLKFFMERRMVIISTVLYFGNRRA